MVCVRACNGGASHWHLVNEFLPRNTLDYKSVYAKPHKRIRIICGEENDAVLDTWPNDTEFSEVWHWAWDMG